MAILTDDELADVLRSALREEYASASDEQMRDALGDVMDAMSPAEAFSLDSALKSAKRLAADPTFQQVVRTAAPIATQALGTYFGGPVGGALAKQLGDVAVNALLPPTAAPAPPPPPPAPPARAAPPPPATPTPPTLAPPALPPAAPIAAGPPGPSATSLAATPAATPAPTSAAVSPVAGGSPAAAQALVLTQQPEVVRALLSTAMGQHGRKQVSGIPVGQLMAMLSQVFGQAAADADELMYLDQEASEAESEGELVAPDWTGSLYADLIGAGNLALADAAEAAEAADLAELADAAESADAAEYADFAGSADLADAAEFADAADYADAAEFAELAEAAEWDGAY